jgi:hypothetical protein
MSFRGKDLGTLQWNSLRVLGDSCHGFHEKIKY